MDGRYSRAARVPGGDGRAAGKDRVSGRLDILVLADVESQSGKARKAAVLGVRRIAEPVFWRLIGVPVDWLHHRGRRGSVTGLAGDTINGWCPRNASWRRESSA
jgi:hypothetical protein